MARDFFNERRKASNTFPGYQQVAERPAKPGSAPVIEREPAGKGAKQATRGVDTLRLASTGSRGVPWIPLTLVAVLIAAAVWVVFVVWPSQSDQESRQATSGQRRVEARPSAPSSPAPPTGELELVWGEHGSSDGRFQKPRAITIDGKDNLYIVDMTARIQVFTPDGIFLRFWQTPVHENGRPTGLDIDRDGNILIADTHYFRVLIYSPQGELLRTIGGKNGTGPGEFGFVTDVVQDSQGFYYVCEYGEHNRIQKFTRDGQFVLKWGGHGTEPGQLMRPQSMVIDADDHIWVTDTSNHRIQVFDTSGKLVKLWGTPGHAPGELNYPYGIVLGGPNELYVIEYGNHRVQKFTHDGQSLGCWGTHGRQHGQMDNPWALARDSKGRLHLLDSNNHRVQRIRF